MHTIQIKPHTLILMSLIFLLPIRACGSRPTRPCPPKHSFISLNPDSFDIQKEYPNEYYLDLNMQDSEDIPLPKDTKKGCYNLSAYVLEMTFQKTDDRPAEARLYFKDHRYKMNISFLQDITSKEPICFDPELDDKSYKNQISDFTCIRAVGAEIPGGAENVEVISATLIKREDNP